MFLGYYSQSTIMWSMDAQIFFSRKIKYNSRYAFYFLLIIIIYGSFCRQFKLIPRNRIWFLLLVIVRHWKYRVKEYTLHQINIKKNFYHDTRNCIYHEFRMRIDTHASSCYGLLMQHRTKTPQIYIQLCIRDVLYVYNLVVEIMEYIYVIAQNDTQVPYMPPHEQLPKFQLNSKPKKHVFSLTSMLNIDKLKTTRDLSLIKSQVSVRKINNH